MKINSKSVFLAVLVAILFFAVTPAHASVNGTIGVICTMEQVDDCTIVWECNNGHVSQQYTDHDNCPPFAALEVEKPTSRARPGRGR